MELAVSEEQIDKVLNKAAEAAETGRSSVPGETYEAGVDAALRWAVGWSDEHPLEED